MPASFFIVILLIALTIITVVLMVISLLATFIVKKISGQEYHTPRWIILLLLPFAAAITFFFSELIYDGIVAGITDANMIFSDYDKTGINKYYEIEGVAQFALFTRTTKEQIIPIDSLYVDGEDVIASNRVFKGDSIFYQLYHVSHKKGYTTCEAIDSSYVPGEIWNRYTQAHNIDRNEVRDCYEICRENNKWNPLIVFLLSLITSLAVGYYMYRRYKAKQK